MGPLSEGMGRPLSISCGVRRMSFYFNLGMNYNNILKSLAVRQGVIISKRHLIRLLKMHGYSRRKYDDLGDEIDFIMQQLKGNGNLHGYRWMYSKCMKLLIIIWHPCK